MKVRFGNASVELWLLGRQTESTARPHQHSAHGLSLSEFRVYSTRVTANRPIYSPKAYKQLLGELMASCKLSLSAHALEGEPLGGLQRMEVAVAACLLARLDQAAHLVRVRVRG